MTRTLSQGSIAQRLTTMNLLVSATALLLACAAFTAYDWVTFRASIVRNLSTQAQIIGANSSSALLFDDPAAGESTLAALAATPTIVSAAIYTSAGRRFTTYGSAGSWDSDLPAIPGGQLESHWFRDGQIVLARKIVFRGALTGTVYIRSDLSDLYSRLVRYAEIAAVVLLMSLLAALAVSWMARSAISRPIVQLAETARIVSREQNYAIRTDAVASSDESAQLIESFNEMLSQIQERDATLQKAREELEQRVRERTVELEASNKELESFSYSVSHDLRAPLRSIDGFSNAVLEDCADQLDSVGKEHLQRVRAATHRMASLIDDMLNLSRVSRGEMRKEQVDLSAVAASIVKEIQSVDEKRNTTFLIQEGITVNGDERLLSVALDNLLRNAWKFTSRHDQARIEFGRREENGQSVYFVSDDGAGFDMQYVDRLFGAFQRLHDGAQFPGTGVGLATVQRIIRRHGGEIRAEAAPEKGATFTFTLWDRGGPRD